MRRRCWRKMQLPLLRPRKNKRRLLAARRKPSPLRSGNIDESADKLGLADITGELLKEGTKTMSSEQVAQAAAQMGSSLGVGVGVDQSTVAMDVLSESGPASVKLIADVVQNPLLPESELARLKTNMLRQIAVSKTQPAQIALARFRKLMYAD